MGIVAIALLTYIVAPLTTVLVIRKWWQGSPPALTTLVGLSAGPLLVALVQYCLLAILPGQQSWVYPIIIGAVFAGLAGWSRSELGTIKKRIKWRVPSLGEIFTALIVIFMFVRMVAYPPTWGDVYEYIEQGYVYSQDKALWRFNTSVPFTSDSTYYSMNNAIRPGLPMLYSVFFLVADPTPLSIILVHFVYFYYFVLLLVGVYYGGKSLGLKGRDRIWPVILLLSCFYILRFTIYGAKEIILMEMTLLTLYCLHELRIRLNPEWRYLTMMSILMGLGSFINLSGTIVAGVMGILFLFWVRYRPRLRILTTALLAGMTIIFGGLEPWTGVQSFIFNPALITQKTVIPNATSLKEAELSNYKLSDRFSTNRTTLNILLKGKFQAFTQPQYFGLIFYVWLGLIIISTIKMEKFGELEKLLLLYIGLYFFVIIDPFSLNPHQYAYVLAISPKYSLMLAPMVVVTIVGRHKTALDLLQQIPTKLTYWLGLSAVLLIPGVRSFLVTQSFFALTTILTTSQENTYYFNLIDGFLKVVGWAGVIVFLTAKYWQKHTGRLLMIGLLMFPTIFLLNSNFMIVPTLRYLFAPLPTKMISGEVAKDNREIFALSRFINDRIDPLSPILFLFRDNRIAFFIDNRERIRMPIDAFPLITLAEHLVNGGITARYIVYTQHEEREPILTIKPTKQLARVGPYIIREIVYEEK